METGTRLGHYEILAPLGEGGMGEVYRARDTTLDRDVAIKVLPEDFALSWLIERLNLEVERSDSHALNLSVLFQSSATPLDSTFKWMVARSGRSFRTLYAPWHSPRVRA